MSEHLELVGGKRRRTRVDVLAFQHGLILVSFVAVQGTYDLPGGGLDEGEMVECAAKREAMEEAGWMVAWPQRIQTTSESLFKGKDDHWFHESGWDEEQQVLVRATAVCYQPDERYRAEGDGRIFKLVPINEVLLGFKTELGRADTTRRRAMHLRLRIEALETV